MHQVFFFIKIPRYFNLFFFFLCVCVWKKTFHNKNAAIPTFNTRRETSRFVNPRASPWGKQLSPQVDKSGCFPTQKAVIVYCSIFNDLQRPFFFLLFFLKILQFSMQTWFLRVLNVGMAAFLLWKVFFHTHTHKKKKNRLKYRGIFIKKKSWCIVSILCITCQLTVCVGKQQDLSPWGESCFPQGLARGLTNLDVSLHWGP
jgi:hypothetical protein